MSYNSAGTFSATAGAETAAAGQILQSAVWDNINISYRTALTQAMQSAMGSNDMNNLLSANGGFDVWQHGAGSSAVISVAANSTEYTADRWYITTGANQAYTVSAVAGLTSPSQLAGAVQRTAGQTGTTAMVFGFPLDTDEVARLRGQKVSLNFYASTGANWSPANGTFTATLYVGTGAVAKRGAGFTNETTVLTISTNLVAGTGATNITGISSSAVPANITQGELQFAWTPTGTAGGADTITFDDVQLEASTFVQNGFIPPFERIPFPAMLGFCQRHYAKSYAYGIAPGSSVTNGDGAVTLSVVTGTFQGFSTRLGVTLRSDSPSVTIYDNAGTAGKMSYYDGSWHNNGTINATLASSNSVYAQIGNTTNSIINFDFGVSAEI